MKYMLDTNVCIFLLNRSRPELTRRIVSHRASDFVLSAITAAELYFGIEKSEHRVKSLKRVEQLMAEIDAAPFDQEAARAYGAVRATLSRKGKSLGPLDTLIAAHAVALGVTLVTQNLKEFQRVRELRVESWG